MVYFIPTSFSGSVRLFAESIPVDTCIVTVSPMDEHGYFTFGTNNDYISSVARQAHQLVVEVNPNMPRVYGQSALHVSEVDAVVENDAALPELAQRPISDVDRLIGRQVAALVPDRACIQIGVGGLPQAVCEELRDRADLGIHSEVFTPALADLVRRGVVTGRYKTLNRGKAVFTFAMGDRDTYRFMNDNIALESYPVNYVNDPAVIAQNDNVISVNSTVEMDLTGACNSEHVNGHQFSAAGGQLDFVRGAYASRGGKSVIAFASTTRGGTISKMVPPALRAGDHTAQRNPLRRHRIRPHQPQGAVEHRTCRRAHRAGTPRLPRLAHRQRPTHAPHVETERRPATARQRDHRTHQQCGHARTRRTASYGVAHRQERAAIEQRAAPPAPGAPTAQLCH